MRQLVINLFIVMGLGIVALLTWAGQQHPADPYLQDIEARGVLRVGLDPTYPPFDALQDAKPVGYDVSLANALAADLGVRVEYHTLSIDILYDALASKQVDILVSALPFVYERQKEVRYSVPYYQSGEVLAIRSGDTSIRSMQDLGGRIVAVELGSNGDTEARLLAREITPTSDLHSTYRSPDEALDALANGMADAAIVDNLSVQTYIAAHPGTLDVIQPPLTDEPYVVAMPVGADALADCVNATIERLRASGELSQMLNTVIP